MPLATLSISSDNVAAPPSAPAPGLASYALKLPGARHHSEPALAPAPAPQPSPRRDRKQSLQQAGKKPRMRKSWSE